MAAEQTQRLPHGDPAKPHLFGGCNRRIARILAYSGEEGPEAPRPHRRLRMWPWERAAAVRKSGLWAIWIER